MTDTQTQDIPRYASGVTAIYGLSGAGKSSLLDTGAEYVAERFGKTTLCVAIDPGGWGNRRLSLIRAGVMSVYDPSNHVDFFDTMEKLSKGAWPETILDADRGYADPNVRLIMPRQPVWIAKCPNGHEAARYQYEAVMMASTATCPTCGVVVNAANQTTAMVIVRPALFARVGLRGFDSLTGMNDRGLTIELPKMSAAGELPVGRSGGSALGSADAVRQGDFVVGTGSEAQVGFMQNRTYAWLVNIRAIPDQVMGAICTFGVEESKDDARGGEVSYGPAIAGKARTSRVPGWVGNCLHATKELDLAGNMRHRLWLTNHIDPRDISKRPYLAKHRGTPLGMPDYLEDPWSEDPKERERLAWSECSLKHFYTLLEAQFAAIAAEDRERFASFADAAGTDADEIVSSQQVATAVMPQAAVSVGAGRSLRRAPAVAPSAPSVIQQQLEASLAVQQAAAVIPPAPPTNGNAAPAAAAGGVAGTSEGGGAPSTPPPPSANAAPPVPSRGLRRTARPPVA